jgi:hypothetical protein
MLGTIHALRPSLLQGVTDDDPAKDDAHRWPEDVRRQDHLLVEASTEASRLGASHLFTLENRLLLPGRRPRLDKQGSTLSQQNLLPPRHPFLW